MRRPRTEVGCCATEKVNRGHCIEINLITDINFIQKSKGVTNINLSIGKKI
jgi:hypothetical protein